jgi:hypothetical protein
VRRWRRASVARKITRPEIIGQDEDKVRVNLGSRRITRGERGKHGGQKEHDPFHFGFSLERPNTNPKRYSFLRYAT